MTKEYIRRCDECGEVIKDLYDYGVTTLYKNIRIGRGHKFHDYDNNNLSNLMDTKNPSDWDSYGRGYTGDDQKEFSFCCPEHLFDFMLKLYKDTYNSNLKYIKENKKERIDDELARMKERHDKQLPVIKEVVQMWQCNFFKKEAIKDINSFIEELNKLKKELK
jgi:hypothetical protein